MQFINFPEIEFFVDAADSKAVYAEYVVTGQEDEPDIRKLSLIDSDEFKSWLRMIYLPTLSESISVTRFIKTIQDYFNVYGSDDAITPKVRTAGKFDDGLMEYALYNKEQQCVQITPNGFDITDSPNHKFLKKSTSGVQVIPQSSDFNLLDFFGCFINTTKEHLVLFVVWLIQAFCEGNHSALLIMGEKGSGKSTLTKQIQCLVDPSRLTATSRQKKSEELLTTLSNSYVVTLDNMRELSDNGSDILCIAVTGGTYAKRTYYTTNDLSIFNLHNTVVLNGINIMPTQSDFADRCLLLNLQKISAEHRLTDIELSKSFNFNLPTILGRIFETLSKAMSIYPTLTPKKSPRMADSYREMLAIAIALDISESDFEKIYFNNISEIDKLRSEDDLVYAVREYMTQHIKGRSIEGTVSEVYTKIKSSFSGSVYTLPKSAAHFSRKVQSEYAIFLAAGFIINFDDTYPDGTHIKIIKK